MNKAFALIALASVCSVSHALIVNPGSTFATSAAISRGLPVWADAGVFNLVTNTNHWWRINLTAGETLTLITTPLLPAGNIPDTIMGLFDGSSSTALIANDDAGTGGSLGSAIRWTAAYTGDHYIAVTGYAANPLSAKSSYEGSNSFTGGQYVLTASIVPEPSTIAVMALGAAALLRRRRK